MPDLPVPTNEPNPAWTPESEHAPWSQISIGPKPPWVEDGNYDPTLVPNPGAQVTILELSRQVDVDAATTYYRQVSRLETALAVQNESQWKLELQPRFQQVQLHGLQVVRQGRPIDQLQRERMRLLQRETKLERLVISGSWTLLVVLDDVRPGDLIEAAYSITDRHPINAGWCEVLFAVPSRIVVGSYRLRVLAQAGRPNLRFRASDDFAPGTEQALADGREAWCWEGTQRDVAEPEPNVPSSTLTFPWIQVTDVPDWAALSKRVAAAWEANRSGGDAAALAEFRRPDEVDTVAVAALIRQIQDTFRYLSVDLATGSWIPAPADAVARQRRGDCKDLTWLAASILRGWGVEARPVLVGSGLRETVADLLPMTSLFNHAVLEVSMAGGRRWFDLTLRHQGGTFRTQPVQRFGYGLPIDLAGAPLAEQPATPPSGLHATRETICLDTRKQALSAIEIRLRTEGYLAEGLRADYTDKGPERFAEERLALVQRRYPHAKRTGTLRWRDDRQQNVCEVVEAFEAPLANPSGGAHARAIFDVPPNQAAQSFACPSDQPRIHPWYMPYPMEVRHNITVRATSMGAMPVRQLRWSGHGYTITLQHALLKGEWSKVTRFRIEAGSIAPPDLPDYATKLKDFLRQSSWRLFMPQNIDRPGLGFHWGELPPVEHGRGAYVGDSNPNQIPEAEIGAEMPQPRPPSRWRFHRPGGRPFSIGLFFAVLIFSLLMSRSCSPGP